MQFWMTEGIEDTQQYQPHGSSDREEDTQATQNLFRGTEVLGQASSVPEPTLGEEGKVEEDGCDAAAGDEEGFEALGADVGDVGDSLIGVH